MAAKRNGVSKWLAQVTEQQAKVRPQDKVASLVLDAKRMALFAGPLAGKLAKLPGIEPGVAAGVKALAAGLDEAEAAWQHSRKTVLGGDRERQRKALAELRARALATARFAWRKDPKAMAHLAVIADGDGSLADHVSDAQALAEALQGDPSLTKLDAKLAGAAERLKVLASALTDAPAEADGALMLERNRYAFALSTLLDELEAGLDFLTRDTPEKRRQYARPRRHASRRPPAAVPAVPG